MRKRLTSQLLIASLVFFVFLYGSLPINAQSSAGSSTTGTEKNTVRVLSEASPGSVGMSAERLGRIDNLVKEYIDKKWIAEYYNWRGPLLQEYFNYRRLNICERY